LLFPCKQCWCNLVNYDYSGWEDIPYSLVLQQSITTTNYQRITGLMLITYIILFW
jgi:hypothetical protein